MVHVGSRYEALTLADVKGIAGEARMAVGTGKGGPTKAGVDILGLVFAPEVNELCKQVAAESRVDVVCRRVPHEILDKKAAELGDIKFFPLGALSVDAKSNGRVVTLKLKDFVIPMDDIPEKRTEGHQTLERSD